MVLFVIEAGIFFHCLAGSLGWINRNFPGFLLIQNKVVAAAGCPFWKEIRFPELLHSELIEVNGNPLFKAGDLSRILHTQPEGAVVSYDLKSRAGEAFSLRTTVHRFSIHDFLALFGVYMLNGLLYLAVGVICVWAWPRWSATSGFLAVGIVTSLWTFTACDLYGPYKFFRLHMLAESLLPAAILHLAILFPTPWMNRKKGNMLISGLYILFFLFAMFYETAAFLPDVYPIMNRIATAGLGVSLIALLARCTWAYFSRNETYPVRALRSLLIFSLAALLPSVVLSISMAVQGYPPANYLGYTSFLLPLGLAVAVLQTRRETEASVAQLFEA